MVKSKLRKLNMAFVKLYNLVSHILTFILTIYSTLVPHSEHCLRVVVFLFEKQIHACLCRTSSNGY